jgi:signal transduction histidine kinase
MSPGQTGFDVIDDGPGISPANLPRIFDRFFTTDRSEGTGLGLALVKAICEAHGGSVTVQSAPGRTVFSVRLPAA